MSIPTDVELAEATLAADTRRLVRVIKLIEAHAPLPMLHILDLACRNGFFTEALAAGGADVLGIEGRAENLGLPTGTLIDREHPRLTYIIDDVRNLSPARAGTFDVTLCLGILYHLDAADAIALLRAMRQVTTRFAIIDTHTYTGDNPDLAVVDGVSYRGRPRLENDEPWSAIGNETSWWFTPLALTDAIHTAGWTHVEWVPGPGWDREEPDRRWLVIT